jgi:N-methylhydantoinase B
VNEGSFRALNVAIQEGNLMMARFPATMAAWSLPVPTVVDTVLRALAPALPNRIPAAHSGQLGGGVIFFGTNPETGRRFVLQSIEGAGWGGRPWGNGASASVSVCQGDVRNAPIENVELKCPVRVEGRALRADSGGAGQHRGGLGVDTTITNLVEGTWGISNTGRRGCPPWGLWGGRPGKVSENLLRLPDAEFAPGDLHRRQVPPGATARVLTAGGGGWGDPLDRDPEAVRWDVLEEYVSLESARDEYGVVLDPDTLAIDGRATEARRAELRAAQPGAPAGGAGA